MLSVVDGAGGFNRRSYRAQGCKRRGGVMRRARDRSQHQRNLFTSKPYAFRRAAVQYAFARSDGCCPPRTERSQAGYLLDNARRREYPEVGMRIRFEHCAPVPAINDQLRAALI